MRVSTSLLLSLALASSATAFQQPALFGTRRIAASRSSIASTAAPEDTGIETGVIKGIREDDAEIDFGRCGVKMAGDTAVRMSGSVDRKKGVAGWKTLDNYLTIQSVASTEGVPIVASAVGIEDYKDPGETTVKTVVYGPDAAAKAVVATAETVMGKETIVVNILGGDELQVCEVVEAVQTVTKGLDIQTDAHVIWNSLSYKEFKDGQATIVVVALEGPHLSMLDKKEDEAGEDSSSPSASSGLTGIERSLAMGEIYMDNDGKFVTVIEEDVIQDFTEDWMV